MQLVTMVTMEPVSVSDEIDQKIKVSQNTWLFLRFFFPSSFRPLEAEIGCLGHLIIVSLQVLPFEFLTLNVEY